MGRVSMYDEKANGERDLYNLETEDYLFKYNLDGSIAVYNLSIEEAEELEEKASEGKEYWGAYLGVGGSIYDDADYEYRECEETNMDYFNEHFAEGKWIDVTPLSEENLYTTTNKSNLLNNSRRLQNT